MSTSIGKRQEILDLLADGKITVKQAADMLDNVKETAPSPTETKSEGSDLDDLIHVKQDPALEYVESAKEAEPSWLHVRVSELESGRSKVKVNIPLSLIRMGLAVGSHFSSELKKFDWDELATLVSTEKGILVDVQDAEDGEHVEIYVD